MSSKRIDHFLGGILGKYVGHSVEHDDGVTDHYVNTGSIIPGEKYIGSSKQEKTSSGGGGGNIPGFGLLLILLSPFLLLIGLIVLSAVVYLGPFYWIYREYFSKKATTNTGERPRLVGIGWVILAFFIFMIGIPYGILLIRGFINTQNATFLSGDKTPQLIVFWLPISWLVCLLLNAVNIVRKNPIGRVVSVFVIFFGLMALGIFVDYKNNQATNIIAEIKRAFITSNPNHTESGVILNNNQILSATSKASQDLSNKYSDIPQISMVSIVLPQQSQIITIRGHGFGTLQPYTGNSDFIRITNTTHDWNAGSSRDIPPDKITLSITKWTDTEVIINGFNGAFSSGLYLLEPGNTIRIQIWNAKTGSESVNYSTVVTSYPLQN